MVKSPLTKDIPQSRIKLQPWSANFILHVLKYIVTQLY